VMTMDSVLDHFLGRSMQQCVQTIAQLLGRPPPASFADDYRVKTTAAFATQLRQVAGVDSALDNLSIPYCVASSSDHARLRTTLGMVGLLPRFDGRLFSVTEVARGKPAPDVFLHAARTLGAAPSACVVIEDTPTGVSAGVAADMTVFGYAASCRDSSIWAVRVLEGCVVDHSQRQFIVAARAVRRWPATSLDSGDSFRGSRARLRRISRGAAHHQSRISESSTAGADLKISLSYQCRSSAAPHCRSAACCRREALPTPGRSSRRARISAYLRQWSRE